MIDFVWPIVFNEWDNFEIIHYSLWFGTKIGSKNNAAISTNKYCNRCKLINSIKLPNNDYLRRLNERVWGIMAIRMFMGWRMFPFMCFYQQILFLLYIFYILFTQTFDILELDIRILDCLTKDIIPYSIAFYSRFQVIFFFVNRNLSSFYSSCFRWVKFVFPHLFMCRFITQ